MPDTPPDHLAPAPVTASGVAPPAEPASPDDVRTLREEHRIMIGLLREIAESSPTAYVREVGRSAIAVPLLGSVQIQALVAICVLLLGVLYMLPSDLRAPVVQRAIDWLVPPPGL